MHKDSNLDGADTETFFPQKIEGYRFVCRDRLKQLHGPAIFTYTGLVEREQIMKISIRQSLSLLTCLLLASIGLASCGGIGSSSNFSKDSMTLYVGQTSGAAGYFPLYVAQQENFIKAQGLTLNPATPPQLGTGPKMTAAVEAGNIEFAAGVITDALTLSRVDGTIKILGALTTDLNIDITVSNKFMQETHLTEASPLADKVKALKGKTIGITAPGSATDAILVYLFRQQGLDAHRDLKLNNLGGSNAASAISALKAGRVDGVAFPVPVGQQAKTQGVGDILISTEHGDIPDLHGEVNAVLYAKQGVIDAKPKAVQAFIRAIGQAETFIHSNPEQAIALFGKYMNQNQKTSTSLFNSIKASYAQTPQISQDGYSAAAQFHVQGGLLAIAPKYDSIIASSTIASALSGSSGS